ncbi:hypothetical protein DL93DRAFT_2057141 [Clavulina sp. PMI_390]|nr:hypothetical protein DL93DRAFT_2057141 [Clavulina sp. PMI_390]
MAEALSAFIHVLNRSPAVTGKSPHEAFYGRKPSVKHLRVFGCCAYAHVAKDKRSSFQVQSLYLHWLSTEYKGWKVWDPL